MGNLQSLIEQFQPEAIHYFRGEATGLRAIVVIHSSVLGPASGGTRFYPYATFDAALEDALRLAKAMTYKCATADLNFGGGKAVLIGDPATDKKTELLRAYGRCVASLNGRFTTGEDVGITTNDLKEIAVETKSKYVAGLRPGVGALSLVTAHGLLSGMKACCKSLYGSDSLEGIRVAVQGVGKVGRRLIENLKAAGAEVFACDVKPDAVEDVRKTLGVKPVEPEQIYEIDCEIFSPCALGGTINDQTIPLLNCDIVAGCANNQLAAPAHGDLLQDIGLLYAPDYIVNAGGLLAGIQDLTGGTLEQARKDAEKIYERMLWIIERSKRECIPTYKAADLMAEQRLEQGKARRAAYRKERR